MDDLAHNLIGITNLDTKLYRIFSFPRALGLFRSQKNGLVRPHMWEDPFENAFLKARIDDNGTEIDISDLRTSWYGQCWTTIPESDAMWRIYSPDKNGVRVSTTAGKLLQSFFDRRDPTHRISRFLGKVEYVNETELFKLFRSLSLTDRLLGGSNSGLAKTLLIKREAFMHEHEVRMLFCDVDRSFSTADVTNFPFDTSAIIGDVLFDPRLEEMDYVAAADEIARAGFKGDIDKSRLYRIPNIMINLS